MLTAIVLRDSELAALSRNELLAVEHILHERLSEIARTRGSGDSALLLAVKAADYLAPLLDELGDDECERLIDDVRESYVGRVALDRATAVSKLTAPNAA